MLSCGTCWKRPVRPKPFVWTAQSLAKCREVHMSISRIIRRMIPKWLLLAGVSAFGTTYSKENIDGESGAIQEPQYSSKFDYLVVDSSNKGNCNEEITVRDTAAIRVIYVLRLDHCLTTNCFKMCIGSSASMGKQYKNRELPSSNWRRM
jgi:hypothetical protein